ncbi:MAG: polymer-forming cytoskeletal protein [Minwuia sp.]|nr:polymer-forming cytoskeletal protein [Minwuia sp.]
MFRNRNETSGDGGDNGTDKGLPRREDAGGGFRADHRTGAARPVPSSFTALNQEHDKVNAEPKTLIVGREIRMKGEIGNCEHVLIHGFAEAALSDCRAFEVSQSGTLNGSAEVQSADVSGRFDGTLKVRGRLIIRAGGRVSGDIAYAEIEIEPGGRLDGQIQSIEPQLVTNKRAIG